MTDLDKLIAAFKTMDAEAREYILNLAQDQAQMWPAAKPRPQPALRLVIGGPK